MKIISNIQKLLWFLQRVLQCHFRLILRGLFFRRCYKLATIGWLIRAVCLREAHAQCPMDLLLWIVCSRPTTTRFPRSTQIFLLKISHGELVERSKKFSLHCMGFLDLTNKALKLLFASSNQMIDKYKRKRKSLSAFAFKFNQINANLSFFESFMLCELPNKAL
jgi:hypothetical protein